MLEKWFKKDINELFEKADRVVLVDVEENYDFLVDSIKTISEINVFKVDDFLSDLEVKYRIEKDFTDDKVLIYSSLKPDETDKRHYLIQEYAATGKKFFRPLNRYIMDKSGLGDSDFKLSEEELIIAGKMSLRPENNNKEFWKRISVQGREAIFGQFENIVLRFLAKPEEFVSLLPSGCNKIIYSLLGNYLDYTPEAGADPNIVAKELANAIFKNIIVGNEDTDKIYQSWLDSHKYRDSLKKYLADFELPEDINIWEVNPDHPFSNIDALWLEELTDTILKNEDIPDYVIVAIHERYKKAEGIEISESHYWDYIYQLITFQEKPNHKIEDLTEFIEFYKTKLYKLDQALRNINQYLVNKSKAKRAFLALYKEKIKPYLDRWFELFGNYRENQKDYLYREIFSKDERKAVIVGDAISYEVSQEILDRFKNNSKYDIKNKIINGDYPSTTVNNMSSLFGSPYFDSRKKRESYLADKLENELQIFILDNVDETNINPNKPAIIYGQDIDSLSEKGHETALKYYSTFIDTVVDKIKVLLDSGYSEVHLTTDHGFVCNFDIDEADKYSSPVEGKIKDRFVLSKQYNPDNSSFIVQELKIEGYDFVYYPKGVDPIKSKQQYGFAHGGITPQEILLPHLIFKKESSSNLNIMIDNKKQLKNIGAVSFTIKLKAEETTSLFKTPRDIILKIEDGERTVFSQELTMAPSAREKIDLSIDLNRYTILVQDAVSKEILDSVKGQKENLRSGLDGFDLD